MYGNCSGSFWKQALLGKYAGSNPMQHASLLQHCLIPSLPQVQPGLGLSETWYSWIVGVASVGEITAAITIAILLRCSVYAKHLLLIGLAVGATGGIFYGIGKNGWMLLIGW